MTLPNLQDYYLPDTTEEAVALLARHGENALVVAGGTFVHGLEVRGLLGNVVALVDIRKLRLHEIARDGGGAVLGATATFAELERSEFVGEPAFGALRDALTYPPQQIRNVGTIGGCVAASAPLYDLPAALLACDGRVRIVGPKGSREVALSGFFRGLFENALDPGELIASIALPAPAPRTASAFLKLESNANDLAILNVAVSLTLDAGGGCAGARIWLGGGVGETYVRAAGAERALLGKQADEAAFAAAGKAATGDFEPVTDHRASAAYRRHVAGVYVQRALATARERLG